MATTKLIYPFSDVFTSEAAPTKNFGVLPSLYTGTLDTDKEYKTLIYFDISQIPANATITSAVLKLYLYRNQLSADQDISIKRLDSKFIEYAVTQATAPTSLALVGSDPATLNITTTTVNQFIEIILTDTVNKWYLNGNLNNGVEISGPAVDGEFLGFWSKEYTDHTLEPILEIKYEESAIEVMSVFEESILPLESGVTSRQVCNSECLLMTYYIDNPAANDEVNIQLMGADTLNGTYNNIGNEIIVYGGVTSSPIYVNEVEKFIRLSLSGINLSNNVTVKSNKKGYKALMSVSSVDSSVVTDAATITLTMTKTLIDNTPTVAQFNVDINSVAYAGTIFTVAVSGTSVTIGLDADAISAGDTVTVDYDAAGPNELTGPNGNVDAFTGEVVTNNL